MTDHVRSDVANGVLTLTLNRPEKKNALTRAMYQALGDAIDGAAADTGVRCVLIQAEGDIFTAGNDLGDFAAVNRGEPPPTGARRRQPAADRAGARDHDAAGRGGATAARSASARRMLLHCDLVFVSDDALLTTPFVNLALVPEAASSLLLPARIGHARAFSMFVLGEAVDAQEGRRLGHRQRGLPASGAARARPRRGRRGRRAARGGRQADQGADARPGGARRAHGTRGPALRRAAGIGGSQGGLRRLRREARARLLARLRNERRKGLDDPFLERRDLRVAHRRLHDRRDCRRPWRCDRDRVLAIRPRPRPARSGARTTKPASASRVRSPSSAPPSWLPLSSALLARPLPSVDPVSPEAPSSTCAIAVTGVGSYLTFSL